MLTKSQSCGQRFYYDFVEHHPGTLRFLQDTSRPLIRSRPPVTSEDASRRDNDETGTVSSQLSDQSSAQRIREGTTPTNDTSTSTGSSSGQRIDTLLRQGQRLEDESPMWILLCFQDNDYYKAIHMPVPQRGVDIDLFQQFRAEYKRFGSRILRSLTFKDVKNIKFVEVSAIRTGLNALL